MDKLTARLDQLLDARVEALISARIDTQLDARIENRMQAGDDHFLKRRIAPEPERQAAITTAHPEPTAATVARITATLQSALPSEDGMVSASKLGSVLRHLVGRDWSDAHVKEVLAAVGGDTAGESVPLDKFITWLFGEEVVQEMQVLDPTSPVVAEKQHRHPEKRATAYRAQQGEQLFRPQSHRNAVLLLRPDGSFSYVHDDMARFSEGVQGRWIQQLGGQVRLEPADFGWCYQETFEANEIIGVCYSVKLSSEPADEEGRLLCALPNELCVRCSWLDPTLPQVGDAFTPTSSKASSIADEECPNSPKVARRRRKKSKDSQEIQASNASSSLIDEEKRRHPEARGNKYQVEAGERLYRPRSHPNGMLLLRPDGSFSYIHDDVARFSEGVQGLWTKQFENDVRLQPTGFGWCYAESFDANEIIGVCHSVTLSTDASDNCGSLFCSFPDELCSRFSWLDPSLPELSGFYSEQTTASSLDEECPNSPKVSRKKRQKASEVDPSSPLVAEDKRRHPERRGNKYQAEEGERIYRPQSRPNGMLLLRADGSFSYIHEDTARFSEGVQGQWTQLPEGDVKLEPTAFGWCYEESFDSNEIVGVCHSVTLSTDQADESGGLMCIFPDNLCKSFSWLDPSLPEVTETPSVQAAPDDVFCLLVEDECPNSPKVARKRRNKDQQVAEVDPSSPMVAAEKRRHPERRAHKYQAEEGEKLYRPRSHQTGMLLLRPDGSFSYVHDDMARFSEGVQGQWTQQVGRDVRLEPTSFGWCYQESFDDNEIIGVCHSVTLSTKQADEGGRFICLLPLELLNRFSWLDPTLREVADPGGDQGTAGVRAEEVLDEECPNSPKAVKKRSSRRKSTEKVDASADPSSPMVAEEKRRHPERRAHKYQVEPGERLYRPKSHPQGMLLLRPDGSFSYVHDQVARFSEGVQGQWLQQVALEVSLEPTAFGWCYDESFDANEIIGVCHSITLSEDQADASGILVCMFPEHLCAQFSWLDPSLPEVKQPFGEVAQSFSEPLDDECPNSPKVARKRRSKDQKVADVDPSSPMVDKDMRRHPERRAHKYQAEDGERLYRLQSHQSGMLLLRPDGTFSYVHDDMARFSEGVQGKWTQLAGNELKLEPTAFGWCYEETFDANEIVGVCHSVTLSTDPPDENGRLMCVLPGELCVAFSWLDPTLPEVSEMVEEEEPTSPRVVRKSRKKDKTTGDRHPERRALKYQVEEGEQLYRPRSHLNGMLLLRPDGSFSYIHDDMARFTEGVQGQWSQEDGGKVRLEPTAFGWCYEESFDANEIIGVGYSIALSTESADEHGRLFCAFPDELLVNFSWLDPTLEELPGPFSSQAAAAANVMVEEDDECPSSPKVFRKRRGR